MKIRIISNNVKNRFTQTTALKRDLQNIVYFDRVVINKSCCYIPRRAEKALQTKKRYQIYETFNTAKTAAKFRNSEIMVNTDKALRLPEVVDITGYSKTTVYRLEKAGKFPKRKDFGARSVRWMLSDVTQYMQSRTDAVGGNSFNPKAQKQNAAQGVK